MTILILGTTVNSLYSGHCRHLELVSSLARVRNRRSLFQSNFCRLFLPGISLLIRDIEVSARRELTVRGYVIFLVCLPALGPRIKKSLLNNEPHSNCRPVPNLRSISKAIEKVVDNRLKQWPTWAPCNIQVTSHQVIALNWLRCLKFKQISSLANTTPALGVERSSSSFSPAIKLYLRRREVNCSCLLG